MKRRKGEPIGEALREREMLLLEETAMLQVEREKMNIAVQLAQMVIRDSVRKFRWGQETLDGLRADLQSAKDGFQSACAKLTHLDHFTKERAWNDLIKAMKKELL